MKNRIEIKNIIKMAYPVLLNYLLMSIFELLDKAVVGHYSIQGFGIVGLAASPIYAITGALGMLSVAFNLIAAKETGKKDYESFEKTFVVSKNLTVIIGSCFLVMSIIGGRIFFQAAYGLEGETLSELMSYFYPASITVMQNMLLFQYSTYYRNKLNTKISFYSTSVSTVINLFFDLSLVYGYCGLPEIGIAGAGWGSVIGLVAGTLVYQIPYYLQKPDNLKLNHCRRKQICRDILNLYPPLLGQEFLESTLFVLVVSSVVARLGTDQMAVYSLLETVIGIIGLPIYAFATATQTYALQNKAAGKEKLVKSYMKMGQFLAMITIVLLCALTFPFRKQLLGLIVSDQLVIQYASNIILIILVVLVVKIPYQFHMSYLQGVDEEKFVFRCMIVAIIFACLGVVMTSSLLGLLGIYTVIAAEYIILGMIYRKRSMVVRIAF